MPIASAQSHICSEVRSYENAVWCAPPANIQASVPVIRSGSGLQNADATGSLGISSCGRHSTSLTSNLKRLSQSTSEVATALPGFDVKTNLAGSCLLPIDKGLTLIPILLPAIVGQISSI